MARQRAFPGQPTEVRSRSSIPVLVVRLGPARDFLIALAVVFVTLIVAMVIAYVAYG